MKFTNYIKESSSKNLKEKEDMLKTKLIKRFNNEKHVSLEELNKIAKDNDKTPEEIYEMVFKILNEFLYRRYEKFTGDKKELMSGIKDEFEHSSEPLIAEIIAKDHLKQVPNYYTLLKKIEPDESKE